ncbi:unnamed protein product, partial [Polarella glacialis]
MADDVLPLEATDILLLVTLLAIALMINNFCQKRSIPIPEAICTIVIGITFGAIAHAFPQVNRGTFQKLEDASSRQFMLVFIAPIIFAEGYGLNRSEFFENISRILVHAFLGTMISTIVVASMVFYLPPLMGQGQGQAGSGNLGLTECLAFGALISSTDPVTTLAIFKDQRLAEQGLGYLYYSVLGESILNDAVAVTLFGSFSDLVESGEELSFGVSMRIMAGFCITFALSTLIGVTSGMATALVLKVARPGADTCGEEHFFFNVPEIGVTLVLACVPFLLAEACNQSGIVAIMFAGITMRRYAHYNLTQVTRQVFLPTVELLASLCETYVFLVLGLGVFLMRPAYSVPVISWSLGACLLGRAAHVYPLSWLVNQISSAPKLSLKEMHIVWLAGLRGAMAFMMALGFPKAGHSGHRDCILCTTVIIVGLSLLCLGWPTAPALRCLAMQGSDDAQVSSESPQRVPRISWTWLAATSPAVRVSEKLQKLLMTADAIDQQRLASVEAMHGFSGFSMAVEARPSLGLHGMHLVSDGGVMPQTATLGSTGGMGLMGG